MQVRLGRTVAIGTVLVALASCGSARDPKLLHFKASRTGPDEFAILPTKPLEAPEDFAALPVPTPGGSNITDPTPDADAVAALGGNPAALAQTTIPAGDQALLAHAGRFGRSGNIREVLAAADLEYRRRNNGRPLERLFNVNVYFDAYTRFELDQHAELLRWRRAGARTPSAPPEIEGE